MAYIEGMHIRTEEVSFADLKDKVFRKIKVVTEDNDKGDTVRVHFFTEDEEYILMHEQDCCEHVYLAEKDGEFEDLLNSPILLAEEVIHMSHSRESGDEEEPTEEVKRLLNKYTGEYRESWTWCFYRIGTVKGTVTMRWLGESNGYYSESVDLVRVVNA